ncbi:adenylate kinase 7 isoform X1 [Amblyraja radiata]|uniref:adenylate kinase 7 isoform X1 n=1 Tax=Amblyraja radiata TaxID=386614 RepID=UPI0014038EEB|nr:adenylate kinase 7 isoform X1 [Amblyraja radiata]
MAGDGDESSVLPEKIRSKRIFINYLDSFVARYVGKYFSNAVVGSSLEDQHEDEEQNEEEATSAKSVQVVKGKYQVVGTLKNPEEKKPDFAFEVFTYDTHDQLFEYLQECDIIIYNITEASEQIDEASWAVSALHSDLENFESPKIFILLSTIMTWAQTKPVDPEDPEAAFTEDDYRKRKSHTNFKDHLSLEKLVVKNGKTKKKKFTTYVVASGVVYGMDESVFHFFFKEAWLGLNPTIPCFGDGKNVIPTIHVNDLASVLQNITEHKPKTYYILALDDSKHTLKEIVKAISKLGPGKILHVPKEDGLLNNELTQSDFDHLLVNLTMEAFFIKENFNIHWVAESGIVENIQTLFKEFKQSRGLMPLKIAIFGPPAVGKTSVAEKLAKHYKLHHIKIKDVINEAIADLELRSTLPDSEEVEEAEEEDDEGEVDGDPQELLDQVRENMGQSSGRLDDMYIVRFIKKKLLSMPCQNQGFILDGFPKTYLQTKDLFGAEEEEEEEGGMNKLPQYDKAITPEHVFALDVSDEFLKQRILNLPESVVIGTHYTQERFLRHLAQYREQNTEDETLLNYFDEIEIHPTHIDVSHDNDAKNMPVVQQIIQMVGKAKNYGPTAEEQKELQRKEADERLVRETAERVEQERREAEETAEKLARWEEWNKRLEEVKKQEQEFLEAHSIPLRNYLMQHVMPTLTQGLIECCKVRPDDPVDFLVRTFHPLCPIINQKNKSI